MRPHKLDVLVPLNDQIEHVNVHHLAEVRAWVVRSHQKPIQLTKRRLPPRRMLLCDHLLLRTLANKLVHAIARVRRDRLGVAIAINVRVQRRHANMLAIRLRGAEDDREELVELTIPDALHGEARTRKVRKEAVAR